jgi:hypothetical protein
MTFSRISVIGVVLIALASLCAAQSPPAPMFLSAGGGYNDQLGMTASFGYPLVGDTTYSVTSADFAAKVDPVTTKRVLFTTFRTGVQQVVAKADLGTAGTLSLAVMGSAGAATGNNTTNLALSTGGALVFSPTKFPQLGFYGSYRAIRDGTLAPTDAAVRSAIGVGVLLKLTRN